MLKVINKTRTIYWNKPNAPVIITGYCEKCGTEVTKSQYGEDEDCPNCNEDLDWVNGNWLKW